jgi:hypothetical protein
MILAYRSLLKTHQQLVNKAKSLSESGRVTLKPVISSIEKQLGEMAGMIAVEVGKRYPVYNRLVGLLGIDGNPSALEALAEVLVLPEWASWRRTKNYFGLWRRDKKTRSHRSRTARQALERRTISLKGYKIRGKELKEVLKTIWINLKARRPDRLQPDGEKTQRTGATTWIHLPPLTGGVVPQYHLPALGLSNVWLEKTTPSPTISPFQK